MVKRSLSIFVLICCLLVGAVVIYSLWPGKLLVTHEGSMLDYQGKPEVVSLAELGDEFSDVAFNTETNTLWVLQAGPARIYEVSTAGKVLRTVDLTGVGDPEALAWMGGDRYVLGEERTETLVEFSLPPHVTKLDLSQEPRLGITHTAMAEPVLHHYSRLPKRDLGNKGIEGLAYDMQRQRLYVAKERDPLALYVIEGYPGDGSTPLHLRNISDWLKPVGFKDLSALNIDYRNGNLLLLSDQSVKVAEITPFGRVVGDLAIAGPLGFLKRSLKMIQPEGVAMDSKGRLYVISEPHQLLIFSKPS